MQLKLYTELKNEIIKKLPSIKYVGLWNNQFTHENVTVPFNYPCVFIGFNNITYIDLLQGVQQCNMNVITYLGFESYKTDDIEILKVKQDLYRVVDGWEQGYWSKLQRSNELQNFDHDNVQCYEIVYNVTGKDFRGDLRPFTPVSATPSFTYEIPH